jgi:hypothetical protein
MASFWFLVITPGSGKERSLMGWQQGFTVEVSALA